MESRKSVRKLAESIRSLLGLKKHLTSSWADSVCNIIKDLPSEEPSSGSHINCLQLKTLHSENENGELYVSASKMQDDLTALNAYIDKLNLERRQALSDFLDLKGNIRVFCRVRPIIEEKEFGQPVLAIVTDSSSVFLKLSESRSKCYSFDKVFHPSASQGEVFSEVEPVIKSALDGYNACIFAYGQTGTGKTFTMEGKPDCPGVVPRAIEALFKQAVDSNHTFFFTFSMLEIYMGSLRDLLIPHRMKPTNPITQCLSIKTDPKGGIEIENLVAIRVSDFNQAKRLYALGSRFRSTASTNSNATSSRSHCLTRISLTCFDAPERRRETSKIWMVDLGGSERVLKTKTCGRRFEEGKSINLSLSALGDVVNALQRRKSHVPYRNSKLTQVLRDSLGEDSRTLMLVHVSPKEEDVCETMCSLGFASRVRSIHLGHEESTEVQVRKESAMAKLLQKVKDLENERHAVREKIRKLKARFEYLTGKEPPSDEQLDAQHLFGEVPHSNTKMARESAGDVTSLTSLQLPRFMRPTVSSRKKFGIDHANKSYSQKKRRTPMRRTSSVRAESVTFPIKDISEYGSECSISKTSCLTDYGTEYSQNTSDCDIKMVVNIDSSERNSAQANTLLRKNDFIDCAMGKAVNVDSSKCLSVDDWLRVEKKEPIRSYAHRSKRVLAISLPGNMNKQNKADTSYQELELSHEFTKQKFNEKNFSSDEVEKLTCMGVPGMSTAEAVINQMSLVDYLAIENSRSNPIYPWEKVKGEIKGISECNAKENDWCCPISRHDVGPLLKVDETECSRKASTEKDTSHNIMNLSEEFCDLVSECELDLCSPIRPSKVSNEIMVSLERDVVTGQNVQTGDVTPDKILKIEENEKLDFSIFPHHSDRTVRPSLCNMKSRKALAMDFKDVDQEDNTVSVAPFHEKECNPVSSGIFDLLGERFQTLCACALLGLGFQELGFEPEFFNALML